MKLSIDTSNAMPSPLASSVYGMVLMLAFTLLDVIIGQTGPTPPRDFVVISAIGAILCMVIHVARCMIFLMGIAIAAMATNTAALERSFRDEMRQKDEEVGNDRAH
jgi:hypothetical protein